MSKEYVLDSSAVIIYLRNAPDASKVSRLFEEARSGEARLIISAINWAESRHVLIRRHGAEQATQLLDRLATGLEIVPVDRVSAEVAGDLRCRFNGSLADAFAASLAMARKATLVTADPEFDAIKRDLKILRLQGAKR